MLCFFWTLAGFELARCVCSWPRVHNLKSLKKVTTFEATFGAVGGWQSLNCCNKLYGSKAWKVHDSHSTYTDFKNLLNLPGMRVFLGQSESHWDRCNGFCTRNAEIWNPGGIPWKSIEVPKLHTWNPGCCWRCDVIQTSGMFERWKPRYVERLVHHISYIPSITVFI